MRLIINLILVAIIATLIYLLVISIQEPISFKNEKDKREAAVVDRLIQLRKGQQIYRAVTGGEFAGNWKDFKQVLKTGRIPFIKVVGDPDDPNFTGTITYDTSYTSALDSVNAMGWNIDSMTYVPYGGGKEFDVKADTLFYQKTLVNVVEVGTLRSAFMGEYSDPRFRRYDARYDPNKPIKFGDMNKPNTSGNWER